MAIHVQKTVKPAGVRQRLLASHTAADNLAARLATHRLAPASARRLAHSLEVGPGEFQRELKILVLFILDSADARDQPLRLLLRLLFERGPVSHGADGREGRLGG